MSQSYAALSICTSSEVEKRLAQLSTMYVVIRSTALSSSRGQEKKNLAAVARMTHLRRSRVSPMLGNSPGCRPNTSSGQRW